MATEVRIDFSNSGVAEAVLSAAGQFYTRLGGANKGGTGTLATALRDTSNLATTFTFVQTAGAAASGFNGVDAPGSGAAAWVNWTLDEQWLGDNVTRICGFGNLDPAKLYTIEATGSRETTGTVRTVDFTVGGSTQKIDIAGNSTLTAKFTDLSPDGSNQILITIATAGDSTTTFNYVNAMRLIEQGATGPSITNIDGGTTFAPGASVVMNGSDFSTTGGSLTIDGVAQTITNRTATAITFTAVRGGNPYDQNLTLTYTDASSNTATLTVQQVAGANEDAVTAANPNTVDEASLWTGLVDTSTGNPITIVDGDQALLKDVNALGNLTATPAGKISANTEGNFVVQIRLASEGIWGSDQTVTFSEPDTTAPAITSVSVPASATYAIGQALNFTANWAESVDIGGVPAINFTIGGQTRQANYASGTGTAASLFSYTVQEGDEGGISVTSLTLDGGTIRDAALNDANLTLNAVGNTSGITVDGVRPIVSVNSASTSNTTPTITGDAGDATSLTLVVTGIGTYNPIPSGGTWSQQLPLSAVGDYPMTLNGTDANGNAAVEAAATLSIVEEVLAAIASIRQPIKSTVRQPLKRSI